MAEMKKKKSKNDKRRKVQRLQRKNMAFKPPTEQRYRVIKDIEEDGEVNCLAFTCPLMDFETDVKEGWKAIM